MLVMFCSFLVLSSSYLYHLQNWLVFKSEQSSKPIKYNMLNSDLGVGIRSIISNDSANPPLSKESYPNITTEQFLAESVADILTPNQSHEVKVIINRLSDTSKKKIEADTNQNNSININRSMPTIVEMSDEILVEFSADYSKYEKQKTLSRLLVVPESLNLTKILSSNPIETAKKPALYKKVLNQNKKPIRYPAQAYRYAEYLMQNESEVIHDEQGEFFIVKIPLNSIKLPEKIKKYQAWVDKFARLNHVSPKLVYAVIDVESAFNPRAVSESNALGLMQIKANTAGRDVYKVIDGRTGQPSQSALFDPQENIRVGTAYLGLLQNNYLQNIRNFENKEMMVISSYNGGISKALELFGDTPKKAIQRINQLHPKQVYRTLRHSHQSDETKRYIDKVMQAKNRYSELLEIASL